MLRGQVCKMSGKGTHVHTYMLSDICTGHCWRHTGPTQSLFTAIFLSPYRVKQKAKRGNEKTLKCRLKELLIIKT